MVKHCIESDDNAQYQCAPTVWPVFALGENVVDILVLYKSLPHTAMGTMSRTGHHRRAFGHHLYRLTQSHSSVRYKVSGVRHQASGVRQHQKFCKWLTNIHVFCITNMSSTRRLLAVYHQSYTSNNQSRQRWRAFTVRVACLSALYYRILYFRVYPRTDRTYQEG